MPLRLIRVVPEQIVNLLADPQPHGVPARIACIPQLVGSPLGPFGRLPTEPVDEIPGRPTDFLRIVIHGHRQRLIGRVARIPRTRILQLVKPAGLLGPAPRLP